MITLPTQISDELVLKEFAFTIVYEITTRDNNVIRVSSVGLTWNGNGYVAVAIKASRVVEQMSYKLPELRVTFSNVEHQFRPYIIPTDILSGAVIVQRLLVKANPTDADYIAQSHIMFKGLIEPVARASDTEITLVAVALGDGNRTPVPYRKLEARCPLLFANNGAFDGGGKCPYNQTSTANGAGVGSTTLIVQAGHGVRFNVSDLPRNIKIGTGAVVSLLSVSTDTLTLGAARSWSNTDPVRWADCDRSWQDCTARQVTHAFAAFLSAAEIRLGELPMIRRPPRVGEGGLPSDPGRRIGQLPIRPLISEPGDPLDFRLTVPLGYGRRLLTGAVIERHTRTHPSGIIPLNVRFHLLCEGTIDSIPLLFADGEKADDIGVGATKVFGMFYRAGGQGIDATESGYGTRLLPQNRDGFGAEPQTYSRSSYAITVQRLSQDSQEVSSWEFDVKFRLCQKYTVLGALDGAPVWTSNPVWHIVDLLLDADYMGRRLTSADIDFAITQPTSTFCDVLQLSVEANTLTTATVTSAEYAVESAQGFYRGMTAELNGTAAGTVLEVPSATKVITDTSRAQVPGDRLRGKHPRFQAHGVFDATEKATRAVQDLLATFNGYITYDAGRIQIRAEEQTSPDAGTFKDFTAAQGFGIRAGSFEWMFEREEADVNRVSVGFDNASLDIGDDEVTIDDWTHRQTNPLKEIALSVPFCNNRDQASRLGQYRLDKIMLARSGHGARVTVGPIGLRIQPGDRITLTHAQANWVDELKRVSRVERIGLGDGAELFNILTLEEYDPGVFGRTGPKPNERPGSGTEIPTITLTVDTADNNRVILSWVVSGDTSAIGGFAVHKDTVSPVSTNRRYAVATLDATATRYTYEPVTAELNTLVYFKVAAILRGGRQRAFSNEVSVIPSGNVVLDPNTGLSVPNMVSGGDFDKNATWTLLAPAATVLRYPDTMTTPGGFNACSPHANITDGNDTTSASGPADDDTVPVNAAVLCEWNAASRRGRVRAVINSTDLAGPTARIQAAAEISKDNGAIWTTIGVTTPLYGKQTFYSADLGLVTMADLHVRSRSVVPAGEHLGTIEVYAVAFEELTGPYSNKGDNAATLIGDGTLYGPIERPFPGQNGNESLAVVFAEGGAGFVTMIAAKRGTPGAALTNPVEVHLVDEADVATLILSVAGADVVDAWRYFAIWYKPVGMVFDGDLRIRVRTKDANAVSIDKLQITPGQHIQPFAPSVWEQNNGYFPDTRTPPPILPWTPAGGWGSSPVYKMAAT